MPSETGVACDAREALHVEHLLHGDATVAIADHIVSASCTATWKPRGEEHKLKMLEP